MTVPRSEVSHGHQALSPGLRCKCDCQRESTLNEQKERPDSSNGRNSQGAKLVED